MPIARVLHPLVGTSRRSAVIATLSALSLAAYLFNSRAVELMRSGWGYLQFVLGALAESPHFRVFAIGVAPSPMALATLAASLVACVAVGMLVTSAMRPSRGAVPMGWTCGLAATVVPTLLIATVRWPDGGGSITNATICAGQWLLLLAVWLWSRRQRSATVAPGAARHASETAFGTGVDDTDAPSWWVWLCLIVAVPYVVTILLNALTGLHGYDSFSDHVAVPARWLVSGRIERGLPGEIVTFYPGNFELLVRWTLALGTDRFAVLLSVASSLLCVWVVYRISRELGQSRTAARVSAIAAGSLQLLAYQSVVVYSDTYTALCLLLATWLLLAWARDGGHDRRLTFGIGLAIGLALGAKYSAGPPAVILGVAWLVYAWREAWTNTSGTERWDVAAFVRHGAVFAAGVLPAMAYWYVRNAIETRNPFYPLSVAGLPGIPLDDLLAGAPGPKTAWDRLVYPWVELGHGPGYETGMGPIFAAVAVIAVLAVPFLRQRPGSMRRLAWLLLLGAYVAWLRTGVLVPRYGLFPLLFSFVFVGELWSAFPSALLRAVVGTSAVATMLAVGHEMLGGVAYEELMFTTAPRVPAVIDSLPPSRILNAAGEPAGYYAMGPGYRHRVISLFSQVMPADVRAVAPQYLLLPEAREREFFVALPLQLVGRRGPLGQSSTSIWRVGASPLAPPISPAP